MENQLEKNRSHSSCFLPWKFTRLCPWPKTTLTQAALIIDHRQQRPSLSWQAYNFRGEKKIIFFSVPMYSHQELRFFVTFSTVDWVVSVRDSLYWESYMPVSRLSVEKHIHTTTKKRENKWMFLRRKEEEVQITPSTKTQQLLLLPLLLQKWKE